MSIPISDLQQLAPSAVIELFELQLNTAQHGSTATYRFHAGSNLNNNGALIWNAQTYMRMPIEADGFEYSGNGQLPRPKVRISNIQGYVTALLLSLPNGLEGAKFTRIRTLARFLDAGNFPGGVSPYSPDPTSEMPREVYFVDRKVSETRDVIEYELCAAFDLQGITAPKRQTIQNVCQWRYRTYNAATSSFDYTHVDCPYTGTAYFRADDSSTNNPAEDLCSKRLSSCELRFGAVTVTGQVYAGNDTLFNLTTSELSRIDIGDVIGGFGVPTGTTVTAKAAMSLTLSANATASSVVTGTGTIANDGLTITMASVAGISPGMAVTGPYVPTGTYVSSVNTSTKVVILSITDNPLVLTAVTTKTGTYDATNNRINLGNTSQVNVGNNIYAYAMGPRGLYNTYQKTAVGQINPNAWIQLNKPQAIPDGSTVTATVSTTATIAPGSYAYVANSTYVVRPREGIPFGSFPGVGSYR